MNPQSCRPFGPGANRGRLLLFLAGLGLLAALPGRGSGRAQADPVPAEANWPQWRGPLGTGVGPAADPPISWSETSNVRWKVKIPGRGTGTPVIWGGRIFLQTAVPAGEKPAEAPPPARPAGAGGLAVAPTEVQRFTLLCLDQQTGKTLWQQVAREELPHEGHHPDHGFASQSPVTDGTHVFAHFGSHGLYCYDLQGRLQWAKDLGRMKTKMGFGEGSSPALYRDTLVVNWDHEGEDFIVGLDKATGSERWRQRRDEDTSWATPLVVEHDGRAQVVTAATRKIRSYDLKTGEPLWECSGMTANTIPTPVAGHGMVYATSGFRGNALLAIRLGRAGDLTGSDAIAWSYNRSTPYVPSPLLSGRRLYFLASNSAIVSCFDALTGQPLINAERLDGVTGVYASPVGAAGRVYLVGRNGVTAVLKDADQLEALATNRLEERFDASPALSGSSLLLRGHENLYCLEAPAGGPGG
jgi:outer membrane protein assembly factor BamB